ncbi:MAG: biotin synthase BioB [Nitrospira sp.]|nr:biotin synthase BioB [Nitrospira sp.]
MNKMTDIVAGKGISRAQALELSKKNGNEVYDIFSLANEMRQKYCGNRIDLCSIINAKSGACSEDCSFCAQSAHNNTDVSVYSIVDRKKISEEASAAKAMGVRRFCVVTSGRSPDDKEIDIICRHIEEIRSLGMLPCATLGLLTAQQITRLKDAGLHRYHNNLETSESYFDEICTTHTYRDKIETIFKAKAAGLSVCSGGIFGLGESWEDRIDMAFALRDIDVDSVPINFLAPVAGTPVAGTPVAGNCTVSPFEALKIIAIYRLIMPDKQIRVCGGRPAALKQLNSLIFFAGADGMLLGNYLTTTGRLPKEDLQMIRDLELEI